MIVDVSLYNNQINARALIGQSAVGYCYFSKFPAPTIAFLAFWLAKKLRL